jgi:hypothetical protein
MRLNYQANRQIAGKKIPSLWGKNWDEIGVFVAYYYSYSKISHLLRAHYRETVFFNHVASCSRMLCFVNTLYIAFTIHYFDTNLNVFQQDRD